MLNLKNSLIIFDKNIKQPEISNSGYSINFYSPKDFYLYPNSFIELNSGFGLKLPEPLIGLMTSKARNNLKYSVGPGQIIYPLYEKELIINLTYTGRNPEKVKKDDPLFQITLLSGIQID